MAQMQNFIGSHVREVMPPQAPSRDLYAEFAPNRFSLNDLGYLAGVNPLELWLVAYLHDHPTRRGRRSSLRASINDSRRMRGS